MSSAASTNPLDNVPSAKPPAGVTSNFIDPPTRAVELLTIGVVFTSLMILALLLRVLVRLRWTKGWGWHDSKITSSLAAGMWNFADEGNYRLLYYRCGGYKSCYDTWCWIADNTSSDLWHT